MTDSAREVAASMDAASAARNPRSASPVARQRKSIAGAFLRWAALAVAAVVWGLVLVPWRLHAARCTPAEHQRGMYWALGAWAVTDLAVAASWAT